MDGADGARGAAAGGGAAGGHTVSRSAFAVRVGLFFAALFLIYGIHLPYLPVWLDWRGLSAAEIGIVTAAPFFVRLVVSPMVALHADQTSSHRGLVVALAWGALAATLALAAAPGFWTILAAAVLLSLAITTIMPLVETVAVSGVRHDGLDYGRMRLWGSVAFVVVTVAGGAVIERFGAGAGIWLLVAAAAIAAGAAHLLPHPRTDAGTSGAAGHGRGVAAARPPRLPRISEAAELLRTPVFLWFLLAAGAIQAAHATFYTFGALEWRRQGIPAGTIGVLWMIGVAAEIALFAWSAAVMRRVWATTLLVAGGVAAVVRWTAMALDPPLALLVPLQLLHGATYGAAHLGAIHFLSRAIPDRTAGTAQALYATVAAGVAMGAATLLAGRVYQGFGGGAGYAAMAAIAALGLGAALAVRRSWTGERIETPAEALRREPAPRPPLAPLPPEQG